MEQKLNIAKILKNKPRGTKLYSMIHGKCSFEAVTDEIFKINFCTSKFGLTQSGECTLIKFGNMYDGGECIIFPSKEMRDWKKFSWKKGDVLVGVGQRIIFEKFIDENYTEFQGKYSLSTYEDKTLVADKRCYTSYFRKLDDNVNVKNYFKEIEKRLGGKLNHETLEIENAQLEFKDGDIIKMTWYKYSAIAIFWKYSNFEKGFDSHVFFNIKKKIIEYNIHGHTLQDKILRLATDSEKQQLFSALEKEGKAWDDKKKQIVDLKPECEFKPFDKVLGRNEKSNIWEADFFSNYREKSQYPFHCVGFNRKYCIPYNEETSHLLGTNDEWKG